MSGVLSSYYIVVHTGTSYSPETYPEAAGTLCDHLSAIFNDADTLAQLTHDTAMTSASTELEISITDDELVGIAVLDVMAPTKVKLDKAKLTKVLRVGPVLERWPKLKVEKKAVPGTMLPD